MNDDYILFIGQEANFQTRSILIPAREFIETRKEDYEILKRTSIKNHVVTINEVDYKIDNLFLQNILYIDNIGMQEIKEYTKICNNLLFYADGLDDDYIDSKDKIWYNKSICCICSGFKHSNNYIKMKKMKTYKGIKINIIDFLFIEKHNKIENEIN